MTRNLPPKLQTVGCGVCVLLSLKSIHTRMSDQEVDNDDDRASVTEILEDPDENTLRVMLSTDNHLGYQEKDPIRGLWN